MNSERRSSLRTTAHLPLQWQLAEARVSIEQLAQRFDVSAALALQDRLAGVDAELEAALKTVRDPGVAGALRAICAKVDAVADSVAVGTTPPGQAAVELSTDGLGLEHDSALPVGTLLAIHLLLPPNYHLLCHGEISHVRTLPRGAHLGVRLLDLSPIAAKRLARYVITAPAS